MTTSTPAKSAQTGMDRTLGMIVAAEIAGTRQQALGFARTPGLVGINQKDGVASLSAVIDDVTRAVARRLFEGDEAGYRAFMEAATR